MAVGQGAVGAWGSYLGIGRETTLGTGVTASAGLDFISASLVSTQEGKILEQVERSRQYSKRILMGKKIEGEIEYYFRPDDAASTFILQNAMGGTITSATATGETVGGAAMTHTFVLGQMESGYSSLTIGMRKGPSSGGKVFQYNGCRVNELTFKAELDEALKCNASVIGIDATVGSTDFESFITVSAADVLT